MLRQMAWALAFCAGLTPAWAQPDLRAEEALPEQSQIYHPTVGKPKKPPGLALKDLQVHSEDGVVLRAWWLPPAPHRPTVLLFHGTLSNLESTEAWFRDFGSLGYGVLAIDYRGYGQSSGRPCESGLYRDARTAYSLVQRLGVESNHLILHGHSLGGAVATQLAIEKPCAGLILESTFTSAPAMGLLMMGPAALAARTRYDTLEKVKKLKVPLLVIHGEADSLIPVAMGRAIYSAAPQPKALWVVPKGGHGGLNGPEYAARTRTWILAQGFKF